MTLFKHPRTPHLPWSPGVTSDDKVLPSLDGFRGREVVVTVKMDGENTSMYRDAIHARSLDSRHHPSRDWVKGFWAGIRNRIIPGWRVVGENVYARHSIRYEVLPSYFLGFQVWDDCNKCCSWDVTLDEFAELGVVPVDVLYRGVFDERRIRRACEYGADWSSTEGYVLRVADAFDYADYGKYVAKFVRAGHVQTDEHWSRGPVVSNGLAETYGEGASHD